MSKKTIISVILFCLLGFGVAGCFKEVDRTPEMAKLEQKIMKAQTDLGDLMQKSGLLYMELKDKKITKVEFAQALAKNSDDIKTTMTSITEASQALSEARGSGSSWADLAKGAVGGVLGRTLLHGAQVAVAGSTGGASGLLQLLFSFLLGGSRSTIKKEIQTLS